MSQGAPNAPSKILMQKNELDICDCFATCQPSQILIMLFAPTWSEYFRNSPNFEKTYFQEQNLNHQVRIEQNAFRKYCNLCRWFEDNARDHGRTTFIFAHGKLEKVSSLVESCVSVTGDRSVKHLNNRNIYQSVIHLPSMIRVNGKQL